MHGGSKEDYEYRIAGLGADILTWDFHNPKQECYSLDLDNRFNNIDPLITARELLRQIDQILLQISTELSWS
jgi:hypothetical protein